MQPLTARPSRLSALTVAQLVVSLIGALGSLLVAALLFVSGDGSQSAPVLTQLAPGQPSSLIWLLVFLALSCIPSIVLSLRSLKGLKSREAVSDRWLERASLLLVVWAGALVWASFMLKKDSPLPLQPLVNLLVVTIPLVWILAFALRKIRVGNWQRLWGTVTGSLVVTMPWILIVEGLILVAAVVGISITAATTPEFSNLISQLTQLNLSSPDQIDLLISQLTPAISSPWVTYSLIFGFCLLVPVLEELLKPLMIWVLAKRELTPAEGFAVGLLCGAAFAAVESLFAMNVSTGLDYSSIALGRSGTGLLHTFNTGMLGWALASTWRDGNGKRVGLVYAGVVLLHGLWNFFALLIGFSSVPLTLSADLSSLANAVPWILGLLAIWMLTLLFVLNRKLQAENPPLSTPTGAGSNNLIEV